jgi:signal peptidase I
MTFPRDDEPGAEAPPGRSIPESQPDPFAPPERAGTTARASQGDLWSDPEPVSPASVQAAAAGDAFGTLEPEEEEEEPGAAGRRYRRIAWELTQTLVLAVLIFLLVRTVAQNFRVEGPSMEPGLHNGQYLLVNKAVYFKLNLGTLSKFIPFLDAEDGETTYLFHGPQRGDVIVFRYPKDPDRDFIKRIIGVPGDTVRVESGFVYVNNVALEEDYISEHAGRDLDSLSEVDCTDAQGRVPDGYYFVLGDNRPNSSDSRSWGCVPEDNIIGKAMLSYWPLDDLGGVGNRSLDLGLIALPLP